MEGLQPNNAVGKHHGLPNKFQMQIVDPDTSDQTNPQALKSYEGASEAPVKLHAYREAAHQASHKADRRRPHQSLRQPPPR